MKLFQIEPEKIVTVTVKNPKGTVINYKTKAVFGKNDMLFLEPVRQGDKILDFSGESLAISVTYAQEDGTVLEWKKCAVKNVRYQKVSYMVLYCAVDAVTVNRRETYRHFLGYGGNFSMERIVKRERLRYVILA